MYCPNCNSEIMPNQSFCGKCGTPVTNTSTAETSTATASLQSNQTVKTKGAWFAPVSVFIAILVLDLVNAIIMPLFKDNNVGMNTPAFINYENSFSNLTNFVSSTAGCIVVILLSFILFKIAFKGSHINKIIVFIPLCFYSFSLIISGILNSLVNYFMDKGAYEYALRTGEAAAANGSSTIIYALIGVAVLIIAPLLSYIVTKKYIKQLYVVK